MEDSTLLNLSEILMPRSYNNFHNFLSSGSNSTGTLKEKLTQFFKETTANNSREIGYIEVGTLKDIFPNVSSIEIIDYLRIFKDLPNRAEIVIRILCYKDESPNTNQPPMTRNKRKLPEKEKNYNYEHIFEKVSRAEEMPILECVENQESKAGDIRSTGQQLSEEVHRPVCDMSIETKKTGMSLATQYSESEISDVPSTHGSAETVVMNFPNHLFCEESMKSSQFSEAYDDENYDGKLKSLPNLMVPLNENDCDELTPQENKITIKLSKTSKSENNWKLFRSATDWIKTENNSSYNEDWLNTENSNNSDTDCTKTESHISIDEDDLANRTYNLDSQSHSTPAYNPESSDCCASNTACLCSSECSTTSPGSPTKSAHTQTNSSKNSTKQVGPISPNYYSSSPSYYPTSPTCSSSPLYGKISPTICSISPSYSLVHSVNVPIDSVSQFYPNVTSQEPSTSCAGNSSRTVSSDTTCSLGSQKYIPMNSGYYQLSPFKSTLDSGYYQFPSKSTHTQVCSTNNSSNPDSFSYCPTNDYNPVSPKYFSSNSTSPTCLITSPNDLPDQPLSNLDVPKNHQVNQTSDLNTAWGEPSTSSVEINDCDNNETVVNLIGVDVEDELDLAEVDESVVYHLAEMFPDVCPFYLRKLCAGKMNTDPTIDDIVTQLLADENYPKRKQKTPSSEREADRVIYFSLLKECLPDADPDYLQMEAEKISNNDQLSQFITSAVENKKYPTLKDYRRRLQLSSQCKQYTTEFNVENFLKLIPNPRETFKDPKRVMNVDRFSQHYAQIFLRNYFCKLSVRVINTTLAKNDGRILSTFKDLEKLISKGIHMKSKRKSTPLPENIENIPLLQEICYLQNKKEIEEAILEKKEGVRMRRLCAKEKGLMVSCGCCFDEEVMPEDAFKCDKGCTFCRDCIKKSTEVAFGDGKLDFPCLNDCNSQFSLYTLQNILDPKMFSKLAQKKAVAEVKAAGIEDLESCPFCDFATIPEEGNKVFQCRNPDCMKESCRLCKEPSHVPLSCDEVEKDAETKARTYIENKMSEALLRECWKCGIKFFKEEGCNKMTCKCGAAMCYICKQPVEDYKHFNGMGGDKYDLCPLYSDIHTVHKSDVLRGANEAKAEIGVKEGQLKIDPASDIADYYKTKSKGVEPYGVPQPPPPPPLQPLFQGNAEMIAQLQRIGYQRQQILARRAMQPPLQERGRRQRGRHYNGEFYLTNQPPQERK